jgi:hypothetical protein
MIVLPLLIGFNALFNQLNDLRFEQANHSRKLDIDRPRWWNQINLEAVHHGDGVLAAKPVFHGYPSGGGEKRYGKACVVHGNGNQMTNAVPTRVHVVHA